MGCGLDHLAFEKKFSSLDVLYRDKDYFLTFLEKSLKTGIRHFIYFWYRNCMAEIFFFGNIGVFFSIKIIIDKKLLKLLFADARYIWSVFLARRTICPDTIKNKCLANDVITEEFSLLFIAVGTLRRNTRPRTTFHEKEFRKKKKIVIKTS